MNKIMGLLIVTIGFLLTVSGCGKEYYAETTLDDNIGKFQNGESGRLLDPNTRATIDDNFTLPDKAKFYTLYSLKGYNYNDSGIIELGHDLYRLYWNVSFIKTDTIEKNGFRYIRFHFKAENKKSPKEIKMLFFLEQNFDSVPRILTNDKISTQMRDALVKEFGETDTVEFIKKNESKKVVMASYAGASVEVKETKFAQEVAPAKPSWGSSIEKQLTGIYESVEPPYVLQLSSGGTLKLQHLQTGDVRSGKWSVENETLVAIWDSNGSQTKFDVESDSSLNKQAEPYSGKLLFVKTQR